MCFSNPQPNFLIFVDYHLSSQVRGERYFKEKSSSKRKSATKSSKKKKKSQPQMYEANDYDDHTNSALRIGLGDSSARHEARKRTNEISLSLEERVKLQEKQNRIEGKTKILTKDQGVINEISYVPKDTRRKMEERKQQDESTEKRGHRTRRGVKELKLKKMSS